jgi:hypothetical protein
MNDAQLTRTNDAQLTRTNHSLLTRANDSQPTRTPNMLPTRSEMISFLPQAEMSMRVSPPQQLSDYIEREYIPTPQTIEPLSLSTYVRSQALPLPLSLPESNFGGIPRTPSADYHVHHSRGEPSNWHNPGPSMKPIQWGIKHKAFATKGSDGKAPRRVEWTEEEVAYIYHWCVRQLQFKPDIRCKVTKCLEDMRNDAHAIEIFHCNHTLDRARLLTGFQKMREINFPFNHEIEYRYVMEWLNFRVDNK